MAHCITFASSKGGSGKTTICANIGTILADVGKKCLIIDCDEATHGMTLMFIDRVNLHRKQNSQPSYGIFDCIVAQEVAANASFAGFRTDNVPNKFDVVKLGENLHLIPATFKFERKPQSQPKEFSALLLELIAEMRNQFDYILIDAQAGTDTASAAAVGLGVCDEVIIVSEFDPLSTAGIERMKAILSEELAFERTRILLNKLLPEFVEKFTEFLSVARYLPPLPWTADVVRAYSKRRLAVDLIRGNEYTSAIISILQEILTGEDLVDFEIWLSNKAKIIREPLSRQLDLEIQSLTDLYATKRKIDEKKYVKKILFLTFLIGIVAALSIFIFRAGSVYFMGSGSVDYYAVLGMVSFVVVSLNLLFVMFGNSDFWSYEGEEAILSSQIRATQKKIEELSFVVKASPPELFSNGRRSKSS